jgi:hypothetical protein
MSNQLGIGGSIDPDRLGLPLRLRRRCLLLQKPRRGEREDVGRPWPAGLSTSACIWCGQLLGRRERSVSAARPPCSYRAIQVWMLLRETPMRSPT